MRIDGRSSEALRPVRLQPGFSKFAEGSCLISVGDTVVLCNASVEEKVPPHVRSGGWITAEYSMLPRANRQRSPRDISKLKLASRSAEIQRLIGRSLRSAADLEALGERTVTIDCDVIQADGGTRTASVCAAWLCLALAVRAGKLPQKALAAEIAAVSVGIVGGDVSLDLEYSEDSRADVDMNVIMTGAGHYVEVQGTGENGDFSDSDLTQMLSYAKRGIESIFDLERALLEETEQL